MQSEQLSSVESGSVDPSQIKDLHQREKKLSQMLAESQKKLEFERKERTSILSQAQKQVTEFNSLKKELGTHGRPYKYSSAGDTVAKRTQLFAIYSAIDVMDSCALIQPSLLHSYHLPQLEFGDKLLGMAINRNIAWQAASLHGVSITPTAGKMGTIMSALKQSRELKNTCEASLLNFMAKKRPLSKDSGSE